jgi:ABC-type cobalt transport system substrate-binding protein/predicted DNA-binding WGR domain protein
MQATHLLLFTKHNLVAMRKNLLRSATVLHYALAFKLSISLLFLFFTTLSYGQISGSEGLNMSGYWNNWDNAEKAWTATVTEADPPAPNYGLRDDGGVNLPTLTYWYSGQAADLTEKGTEFDGKSLGELTALYLKGASIKTWKNGDGDVTGAKFSYKVWENSASEPATYTERDVFWSSDDGGGNQTWANFGAEIEATAALDPGTYNLKIFFSITGTGVPGTTEDGPFTATFVIPEPASSDAEILTFTLAEQTAAAVINSAAATVAVEVANGTDLSSLTPTITVSDGAAIAPASGVAQDFSAPVEYTVTAEDNTEKVWTVTVAEADPPAPNYGLRDDGGVNLPTLTYWYSGQAADLTEKGTEFDGKSLGELTALYLKGASIKTWKNGDGNVTGAKFSYKVWENSASEPATYTERDVFWSSDDGGGNQTWANFGAEIEATAALDSGTYNLKIFFSITGTGVPGTTEDGPFTATFVIPEPASSDAEILTFTLAEQTGAAVINSAAATVAVEVANGTDLSSLTPAITVSDGASVDPASGVAQDFSAPVQYTVTAEDNTEKVWTVTVTEAEIVIGWANLQWPENGSITVGDAFDVYAQVNSAGVTDQAGQGTGITAWIVYSTEDTDPATWTNWIAASYNGDAGNNDEHTADLGAEIAAAGTYYYASRFQPDGGSFVYGGYNGGFWDGTSNVSGVLTVSEPASGDAEILTFTLAEQTGGAVINSAAATVAVEVANGTDVSSLTPAITVSDGAAIAPASGVAQDFSAPVEYTVTAEDNTEKVWTVTVTEAEIVIGWANLQWPENGSITVGDAFDVYAQVYSAGVTDQAGQGTGITAWIGYSTEDTDPATWTNWIAASYNGDAGNNDEYTADLGAEIAAAGTYYYASRFQPDGGSFVYGGYNGGFWDGTTNVSGVLTVNEPASGDAEILTFTLAEQTGAAVINSGAATVAVEVANGTDVSSLTPAITVSDGADIAPASGVAQDFSAPVEYTVTAENNTEKVWTVTVTEAEIVIGWANLQWPENGTITTGDAFDVYAQVYSAGVTDQAGQGTGITAWIGYSTEDTDPATWTNWIAASYNGDAGNNDEYTADLGAEIAAAGTYYYASRFQPDGGSFVYGGYNGGFWDGTNNVSGVLTVNEEAADPVIGFANLQWPASGNIEPLQEFNVYAQAWIDGITGSGSATADLQAWIGYSTDDTDPATWTNWVAADFSSAQGNNDEFVLDLGAEMINEGTFYYASRFKYLEQDYVYGGFNGGFWDGTNNVSGVLTVAEVIETFPVLFTIIDETESYQAIEFKGAMTNWATVPMTEGPDFTWTLSLDIPAGTYEWGAIENDGSDDGIWLIQGPNLSVTVAGDGTVSGDVSYTIPAAADPEIGFANLQWPASGNIEPLQEFNVYAQAWIDGITGSGAATAELQAWIGYSTDDTDPATWTNWVAADFSSAQGNNDEFVLDLGAEMSAEGTFYYASRFKYLEQDFVYGGFNGGFWDGTNNVSGVLTVAEVIETFPVLFTIIDETESYQAIELKGAMTNWATVPMTEGPDYTWTLSLDIPAGTYEWGAIENDGSDDGIWLIVGPNPSVTIAGDGTVSGDVTYIIPAAADPEIGFANLQWPASGNIEPLQEFNVYAQAWIDGLTGSGTATEGLQAWIGYSTGNTDPATWTMWIPADFNAAVGNNDEFVADLGAEMGSPGTFYYATRFQYEDQEFVYGGYSASGGGYWDGVDNVSGVLTVSEDTPDPEITFANLQFPGSASILIGGSVEVYAQVEAIGVDLNDTGYDGMTVWIGYSDDDTDPAGWTNWFEADYNGISGFTNRPEYLAEIGSDITEAGTYYYASRFQLDGGAFVYGGFDGGFWDGVNNVSGVLTVNEEAPDPEIGFANLQWPPSGTITPLQQYDVYGQVWIDGLTGSGTATEGLQAWIGYSTGNTDPATWTMWIPADFNTAVGNNDEFVADLGAEMGSPGTFYYATRFQYEDQEFVYGGYSDSGGGYWDGVDNVSGVLTVSEDTPDPEIGWANLQWPPAGVIEPGEEFITYAQVWIENITGSGTATADLQSWMGWSTEDTDPAGWTNWIAADYNTAVGSNDEFMANLGAALTEEGTYYYASRFQYLDQEFVYGGYSDAGGGFWDGENNVSGQLIVVNEVVTYPVTFTVTDATGLYSNIKLKGEMTNWETIAMQQNGNEWTLTLDILPGSYEWGVIEDDGTPDGIWLIEGPNLVVNIAPDGTITGDTSYVITYVGLAENKLEFNLYPNPAKDRIFLKSKHTVEANILLTDAHGQKINEFVGSENTIMINLTGLKPGVYILHIISDNQMITKRFIKQ